MGLLFLVWVSLSICGYFSSIILTMYLYVQDKLCIKSHGLLYTFKSWCRMLVGEGEIVEAEGYTTDTSKLLPVFSSLKRRNTLLYSPKSFILNS